MADNVDQETEKKFKIIKKNSFFGAKLNTPNMKLRLGVPRKETN